MRRAPPVTPPAAPSARDADPPRLLRGQDAGLTDLMRAYARRTRPGERGTVTAWYRLRPLLDPGSRAAGAPELRSRWIGARLLSGALTTALILLVAVAARPARRAATAATPVATPATEGEARRTVGPGGASGWGQLGAGGAEGSTGAHGRGETVSADLSATAAATPRAG